MIRRQAGYSLIEIVVAMTVLAVGASILWYSVRSSARLEKLNRLHHEGILLARSDLESLRSVPRQEIKDTSYRIAGPGGDELMLVREVFDSAKIVSTLAEVALDDRMSPVELRKPLEVRVRVFMAMPGEEGDFPEPMQDWNAGEEDPQVGKRRTLASLIIKIPEYRWH